MQRIESPNLLYTHRGESNGGGLGIVGGRLASFSIQNEKFLLQKHWARLTCPTFNFLPVCVSPLSMCRRCIWSWTEALNPPPCQELMLCFWWHERCWLSPRCRGWMLKAAVMRTKQIKHGRRPSVFRNKEKTQGLTSSFAFSL